MNIFKQIVKDKETCSKTLIFFQSRSSSFEGFFLYPWIPALIWKENSLIASHKHVKGRRKNYRKHFLDDKHQIYFPIGSTAHAREWKKLVMIPLWGLFRTVVTNVWAFLWIFLKFYVVLWCRKYNFALLINPEKS